MPEKCLNPADKSFFLIDIRRFQAKNPSFHDSKTWFYFSGATHFTLIPEK